MHEISHLNQIFRNWIQLHMKMVIFNKQVCFIPGKQGWINTYESIHVIQKIKTQAQKQDDNINVEKAFGKV